MNSPGFAAPPFSSAPPPFPNAAHGGLPIMPEATGDGVPAASSNSPQRHWSFNFKNAPWQTVLRSFAREAGYSLQLAAPADGEFSYFDEGLYTATETLDLFNDYLLESGRILIRSERRLTLADANSAIADNLIPYVSIQQIDGLGRNELASVAIPLRGGDMAQAVAEVLELKSGVGQVKPLTNSGRIIVTDTGQYLRRIRDLLLGSGVAAGDEHSFVYQLKHAQAEEVAKAITEFLSSNGGAAGGGGGGSGVVDMGGIGGSGAKGQRVVAEKTTNSLLIRGSTDEMAIIQQLVLDLDRAPREVLVQALLVEVELGNTHELGVELGFQDSVLFDRSVVDQLVTISQTTTAPNGTQTTNQNIISRTAAPGFHFNNQPLGNNVAANPNHIASQGLSTLGVGRVNGDLGFGGLVLSAGSESVNLLLRALDANFSIDVLSRPQIRAVESHEAFIQIGQQVPVVDGVSVTPVGSANPVIRQDQAGIILKVTPRISPDGRVQLAVNAEKSAFNLTPGTGVPIFTDATNGNVIEAPIKDITTADTTVSVQSGQTIVLGGMITNDQIVVVRKVPFLGDIPFLGHLFRYDLNRHKRKELLVFLTPIVLDDYGHQECVKAAEARHVHIPAEAFSFGDNLSGNYFGSANSDAQHMPYTAPEMLGQRSATHDQRSNSIPAATSAGPIQNAGHQQPSADMSAPNSGPVTQQVGYTRSAPVSDSNLRPTSQQPQQVSSQASRPQPQDAAQKSSFRSRWNTFRSNLLPPKPRVPAQSPPSHFRSPALSPELTRATAE
jgi:type II secretory pathway component GspD/PulD (secretin)